MPQAVAIPIATAVIGAAATGVGSALKAKQEQKQLDRMYPGMTEEQKALRNSLVQGAQDRMSGGGQANPFLEGLAGQGQQSTAKLEQLRNKVALLQQRALDRDEEIKARGMTQSPNASFNTNPFV